MKKTLLICSLGYLCVPTSTLTAQVADSPGADFLHRSSPSVPFGLRDTHRGGATRSDTLAEQNGLVDHSVAKGQEGESSSASVGALIYGEIINPDSLGPITLQISPYGPENLFNATEMMLPTTHGTFFDGVLDSRVRKFKADLSLETDFVYLTLKVGDRPVLEDFILAKGDSIKFGIDLQRFHVVFGGPSRFWFETQYAIARNQAQEKFDSPRVLLETDREALLDRNDNRAQKNAAENTFGARLSILELGEEVVDRDRALLSRDQQDRIPGIASLVAAKDLLSAERYKLLKAELIGNFYGLHLSSLRRHGLARAIHQEEATTVLTHEVQTLLADMKIRMEEMANSPISAGYLKMAYEWSLTKAMVDQTSFPEIAIREFEGEARDRLLYDYSVQRLNRREDPREFIAEVLRHIENDPWRQHLQDLAEQFALHVPLRPVTFEAAEGGKFTVDELKGSPTLLYFYFSSCAASEGYFRNNLWPLYNELAEQLGFKLVAVSVDNDPIRWKAAIDTYSDHTLINTNLPSRKWKEWLDYYLIDAYPRTILLDAEANILSLSMKGGSYTDFKERFLQLIDRNKNTDQPISALTTKIPNL